MPGSVSSQAAIVGSNIAFNAPSQMRLGEAKTIELRLSPSAEVQELTAQIRESGAVGQIESAEQIPTSAVMQARLTGQDFKIEARSDERQAVSRKDPTIWRWDIEPTEPGEKRLHLTLSALVKVEGESASRQIESFDRAIPVTVPLGQRLSGFVGNNWQWLWTVIALPVVVWVWRTWKTRREEEPPFRLPPS